MKTPTEMPYWMRSIGRHLRRQVAPEGTLPFPVKQNLLRLLSLEGDMRLLRVYPGLF